MLSKIGHYQKSQCVLKTQCYFRFKCNIQLIFSFQIFKVGTFSSIYRVWRKSTYLHFNIQESVKMKEFSSTLLLFYLTELIQQHLTILQLKWLREEKKNNAHFGTFTFSCFQEQLCFGVKSSCLFYFVLAFLWK